MRFLSEVSRHECPSILTPDTTVVEHVYQRIICRYQQAYLTCTAGVHQFFDLVLYLLRDLRQVCLLKETELFGLGSPMLAFSARS